MATWTKVANAPDVVNIKSEKLTRATERAVIWGSVMEAAKGAEKAFQHKDYNKTQGIITVHNEFQNQNGYDLTLPWTPAIFSPGVLGDASAIDQSINLNIQGLTMRFNAVRLPFQSSGKVQEQISLLKFMDVAEGSAKTWAPRQLEGSITAMLWGIAAPANTAVQTYLNMPAGTMDVIMNNTITDFAFDSEHTVYAGAIDPATGVSVNTTNAMVAADTTALLSADFLDYLETTIMENDEPPELVDVGGGQQGLFYFTNGRGVEQLKGDPAYQRAVQQTAGADNALAKRAIGKYGLFYIVEYSHCLSPLANVGQDVVCGRNALQFAKVSSLLPWVGTKDTHDWIKLYAIAMEYGVVPSFWQSERKNSWAVRRYQRT